jgi:energy-coupling factor transport system permease protein
MSIFIQGKTFWFKLDPRVRVIFLLSVFLIAFAFDDPLILFLILAALAGFLMLNELPIKKLVSIVLPLTITLIFYALITIFWVNPTPQQYRLTPFAYIWGKSFPLDVGSLLYLCGILERVYIMTISAWFVTLSITPPELVAALSRCRLPPSFSVAGAASFASLPFLQSIISTIKEAVQSKGWETENKGLIGTLRSFSPILFPVFFMTMKRSQDLALAMECRGISQIQNRKPRRKLKYNTLDWGFTLVLLGAGFGSLILYYVFGFGHVDFTINLLRAVGLLPKI